VDSAPRVHSQLGPGLLESISIKVRLQACGAPSDKTVDKSHAFVVLGPLWHVFIGHPSTCFYLHRDVDWPQDSAALNTGTRIQ